MLCTINSYVVTLAWGVVIGSLAAVGLVYWLQRKLRRKNN